LVNQPESA